MCQVGFLRWWCVVRRDVHSPVPKCFRGLGHERWEVVGLRQLSRALRRGEVAQPAATNATAAAAKASPTPCTRWIVSRRTTAARRTVVAGYNEAITDTTANRP